MKRFWALAVIFGASFFLLAMGEIGGTPATPKIPSPEKNFAVQVVDRQDIKTSLMQFSHDGKIHLAGKMGSAIVTIPFEKISQIRFSLSSQGNESSATVWLKDQKQIQIQVERRSKFYGQADFGTFQIEAKDLKSIHFQP